MPNAACSPRRGKGHIGIDPVRDARYTESVPEGEILVVGGEPQVMGSDRWPVIATTGPHVAVVRGEPGDLEEIAQHARLAVARLPHGGTRVLGDEGALDDLDEGARLFVAAWRERPLSKPDRVGEGLSWDAPGFEPPDRPSR